MRQSMVLRHRPMAEKIRVNNGVNKYNRGAPEPAVAIVSENPDNHD
jgi:hypothetical protein